MRPKQVRANRGTFVMAAAALCSTAHISFAAKTPRFDAGRTYYGRCADANGGVLPFYARDFTKSRQKGLDLCLKTYGKKVIAYAVEEHGYYDSLEGVQIDCVFDPNDLPEVADGWVDESDFYSGEFPLVGGNDEFPVQCYDFMADPTPQPTLSTLEAPSFLSGNVYTGECVNAQGRETKSYVYQLDASDKTPQDGLDLCFATFGDKVIAYAFTKIVYSPYRWSRTTNFACYFDPLAELPPLPFGWYDWGDDFEELPITGGDGDESSRCYLFGTGPLDPAILDSSWGFCVNKHEEVLKNYYRDFDGRTPKEALQDCFDTFGRNKVIGFGFELGYDSYACYFDPTDLPDLPPTWDVWGFDVKAPIVGGSGDATSICFTLNNPGSSSPPSLTSHSTPSPTLGPTRFLTLQPTLEPTRSLTIHPTPFPTLRPARLPTPVPTGESAPPQINSALSAIGECVGTEGGVMPYFFHLFATLSIASSPQAALDACFAYFGDAVIAIGMHEDVLGFSCYFDPTNMPAQPMNWELVESVALPPVIGGSGIADELAFDGRVPSFMFLVSDGILLKPKHWPNYEDLKAKLDKRLGNAAPRILCFRTDGDENTWFLDIVCDETYFEGMAGGKLLNEVAADIASRICS
ncbi:Hypothetical Protein FCC1311_101772 [Hondaea fermentalgiana]|uniref:Uncharacterized protein n=1 Tax=Hondaea fermentalgiana TaxID=2315210 RepID=A0A2R5H0V6_9STRA|nr:Hypothetical Protein FCC1311_101772 [Hondaea fermentalgiana]|eukprot:GBG33954.1 Hypothetical Protein FCC1311_101772 [Hondaea fermentalgiana]